MRFELRRQIMGIIESITVWQGLSLDQNAPLFAGPATSLNPTPPTLTGSTPSPMAPAPRAAALAKSSTVSHEIGLQLGKASMLPEASSALAQSERKPKKRKVCLAIPDRPAKLALKEDMVTVPK